MAQTAPIASPGCLHGSRGRQKTGAAWAMLGLVLVTPPAQASQPVEPVERIRAAATEFFAQASEADTTRTRVEVGRIDSRIRLPACDRPLDAALPAGARATGRTAVLVSCEGARPWRLYVPVRVRVFAEVAVASRDLLPGEVISRADLQLAERDLGRLSAGYVRRAGELIGRRLRGPVRAGKVISRRVTETTPVVETGQRVEFLAASSGVAVKTTATALSDGRPGDRIRVRNESTARVMEGIVRDDGVVEAGPR